MEWNWTLTLIGLLGLAAAVPWVARIRHPDQRPLAAYLVFALVTLSAMLVLYFLLAYLFEMLGLLKALSDPRLAALFVLLVLVPAIALGSWQARKPPLARRPPP